MRLCVYATQLNFDVRSDAGDTKQHFKNYEKFKLFYIANAIVF